MDFASLVVLSYHRPDFMDRSLGSLMTSAPLTKFEVIVVDDGSRDACWPYLMQATRSREISSLVINAGDNMGVGVGMNRGFSLARGKWLAKLDADLEYEPGWLDAGVNLLEKFPKVAVVGFFDYRNYAPDDNRFNKIGELTDADGKLAGYVVDDFVGSAFLIRRKDWLRYGIMGIDFSKPGSPVDYPNLTWRGFEEGSEAFAEDVEWKRRMVALGYQLAILPKDYVSNFGFGIGNSTVAIAHEGNAVVPAKIHKEPLLFGGRRPAK